MLPAQNKNLKDPEGSLKDITSVPAPYQAAGFGSGSFTKANKLITALYMVTDIIDKEEPLRTKLRTLGTDIISDTYTKPLDACIKIAEIMSFLDIASAMSIVSLMNYTILKKEFSELDTSIKEYTGQTSNPNRQVNLSEFFLEELPSLGQSGIKDTRHSIRHHRSTRIGVQKGSTLMKALSDKTRLLSNNGFDILKKQRRNDIINIIKDNGGNATIKDIRTRINTGLAGSLVYSEKTIQRELLSMVRDSVLYKTGEKRWSKYSLPR